MSLDRRGFGIPSNIYRWAVGWFTQAGITAALGFTPENTANKNQASGYAGLDGAGKIDPSAIPVLRSHEYTVVADATARKAQTTAQVQPGDSTRETSTGRTYVLIATDPTQDASWVLESDTTPDWTEISNKPDFPALYAPIDSPNFTTDATIIGNRILTEIYGGNTVSLVNGDGVGLHYTPDEAGLGSSTTYINFDIGAHEARVIADGGFYVNGIKITGAQTSFLDTDYTNATTNFTETNLVAAAQAGKYYKFILNVFAANTQAAEGFKIDFNGNGGGTAASLSYFRAGGLTSLVTGVNDIKSRCLQ